MKTVLVVAAALMSSAANAFASEAYSDPGEYRTPGVTYPTSATTFVGPDTTTTPGATVPMSAMTFSEPDTSSAPGTTYPASTGHVAIQTAK